jgi:dTDP-4-amino-4,6-dideoxygalactose transaminase
MNTFSTFGANYTLSFALKVLTAPSKPKYHKELTELLEKRYKGRVVLTYKCREAIELALRSCNFPKGSFVAICKYSCNEVIGAIKAAGLKPHFVKLENGGLNFSAKELGKAIIKNPKIKAVLIQNTLGYPCKIEGLVKLCHQKKLVLIEDLAHSVGAEYKKGVEVGSYGDFVTFSFSQNKILDSTAGGALVMKNGYHITPPTKEPNFKRQLADRLYPFLSYFIKYSYPLYSVFNKLILWSKKHTNVGDGAHKLPDWQGLLILSRFKNISEELQHRRRISSIYSRLINKKILYQSLISQVPQSANFRFPILVKEEQGLVKYLATNKIYLDDPWYTIPGLTLPTHINVSEKKAAEISLLINRWLKNQP